MISILNRSSKSININSTRKIAKFSQLSRKRAYSEVLDRFQRLNKRISFKKNEIRQRVVNVKDKILTIPNGLCISR